MARPRLAGAVAPTWRLAFVSNEPESAAFLPNSNSPAADKSYRAQDNNPLFVSLHSLRRRLGPFRLTATAHPTTATTTTTTHELPCHAIVQLNAIAPASAAKTHTDCTETSPAAQTRPPAAASKQPPRSSLLIPSPSHHFALSQSAYPDLLAQTPAHVRIRLGTAAQGPRRSAARAFEASPWTSKRRAARSGQSRVQKSYQRRNICRTAYKSEERETLGPNARGSPISALECRPDATTTSSSRKERTAGMPLRDRMIARL